MAPRPSDAVASRIGRSPVTEISDGVAVVCTVVRAGNGPEETQFFTGHDSTLQVGMIVHPSGHVIPRHRHVSTRREILETGEVLVVRNGRCLIELFSRTGEPLEQVEVGPGDVVILSGAAHRLTMLEDTVLLEVKQGPYAGPAEKEIF